MNTQWTKTHQEGQYHSWDEVQTLAFKPTYVPEIIEITLSNIRGGFFRLGYGTTYSNWVHLDARGGAYAAQELEAVLASSFMNGAVCQSGTKVTHIGEPNITGTITFAITSNCLPRTTASMQQQADFWNSKKIGVQTNSLVSNYTTGEDAPVGYTVGKTRAKCLKMGDPSMFNQGDKTLNPAQTYTHDLGGGRTATLTGWTHTRSDAKGYLRNIPGTASMIVSGLAPGTTYGYTLYQFASSAGGTNQLSVNGGASFDVIQKNSDAATKVGTAVANQNGTIAFVFTRIAGHVHLSGIDVVDGRHSRVFKLVDVTLETCKKACDADLDCRHFSYASTASRFVGNCIACFDMVNSSAEHDANFQSYDKVHWNTTTSTKTTTTMTTATTTTTTTTATTTASPEPLTTTPFDTTTIAAATTAFAPTAAEAAPSVALVKRVVQPASTRMTGTFRISLNGFDFTNDIMIGASAATVAQRVRLSLSLVRELTVTRDDNTKDYNLVKYTFYFRAHGKNLPKMYVWDTGMMPRHYGASVDIEVNALTDGGQDDLYYSPIPSDFFEVRTELPNAHIAINGITAECSTHRSITGEKYDESFPPFYAIDRDIEMNCMGDPSAEDCYFDYDRPDCSFVYDPARTPIITGVITEREGNTAVFGDQLTINGTGFEGFVAVNFGGGSCHVISHNTTYIRCVVSHMKSGRYHPVVVSSVVGQAELAEGVAKVVYQLVIASHAPVHSSVRGGGMLIINGTGFSNIAHENHIVVGGGACYAKASDFDYVLCHIPFSHGVLDIDEVCWGGAECVDKVEAENREVEITQSGTQFAWTMAADTANVIADNGNWPQIVVYDDDAVTFVGAPGGIHNFALKVASAAGQTAGAVLAGPTGFGQSFEERWVPPAVGTYTYYCVPHEATNNGNMQGEIVVLSKDDGCSTLGSEIDGVRAEYTSTVIATWSIFSVALCRAECTKNDQCVYFTVRTTGDTTGCTLSSARTDTVQPSDHVAGQGECRMQQVGKRARRSGNTTAVTDIALQVFQYDDQLFESRSGVFEDDGRERAQCLSTVLDGAWGAWSGEMESLLRDTKYFGYSCKLCNEQISIAHKRWGYKVQGEGYIVDSKSAGWMDGAWSQWDDSGNYLPYEGIMSSLSKVDSPYTSAGSITDEACADDLAVLRNITVDGGWSSWGHPGSWGEWATEEATFAYDWALTPSITKITPSQIGSALTTKLTIEGNFKAFSNGTAGCSANLRFVSPSGLFRECQQLKIYDDHATCVAVRVRTPLRRCATRCYPPPPPPPPPPPRQGPAPPPPLCPHPLRAPPPLFPPPPPPPPPSIVARVMPVARHRF